MTRADLDVIPLARPVIGAREEELVLEVLRSGQLSLGQQRRVALARALLSTAPVLILDEPATGLDDTAERAFLATLNEAAAGRTVVLIVHRLVGVERLDRIWRLSGGRAVAAMG